MFAEACGRGQGLRVGTRSRILKVVKTPIEAQDFDAAVHLSGLLGYDFFSRDERGVPREFDPRLGADRSQRFRERVNDLAYDACAMLEVLVGRESTRRTVTPSTKGTVYLAETTYDLADEAARLRRELQQFGHEVIPVTPYQHGPKYADSVRADLKRATLSIHPLGRSYGTVPEGFDTSVVALQRAAADDEAQKRSTFTPLVWSPTGVTSDDPRQQKLLSDAQSDPHYLISSLETLKSTILRSLEPPPEAPSKPSGKNDVLTIYMICGRSDLDAVRPVESFLIDQGYDVILPLFDGDERELREDHEQSLATCDAVVIYYGASTEFWQRTKLRDLRKAIGYGRYRPFSVRYIFCADPKRADKESFRSNELTVLDLYGQFSPSSLKPFLDSLSAARDRAV